MQADFQLAFLFATISCQKQYEVGFYFLIVSILLN
jgi:hypothetical protein